MPTVDRDSFVRAMLRDKKVERGQLRFILPTRLGHVQTVDNVAQSDVVAAMALE
jgi:3-dehydroquinate synthase